MKITKHKLEFLASPIRNERGIGVISVLVSVVIFLIILTGVFALVGRTTEGSRMQQVQQDVLAIQSTARQVYSSSKDYAGLDTATAIASGILSEALVSGGSGKHPWGGDITVAVTAADTSTFEITYAAVPRGACIQLAAFNNGNWEKVTAGETDIPQNGTGVVAAATTGCGENGDDVVFTSR